MIWEIGLLPFMWGELPTPTNGPDLPDALPFTLSFDEQTGRIYQVEREEVDEALTVAYEKGSKISGMMDSVGLGRRYAEDFIAYLQRSIGQKRLDGMRVLEIGCGKGYLLFALEQLGASCIGIEPGVHGQDGAKEYGVRIVRDEFPSNQIEGKFDLIILYAVLEHVSQPVEFLAAIKNAMTPDGRIVLSVPDCGPYIRTGDISMLIHEHWSYFTKRTLEAMLLMAGMKSVEITASGFGGSLNATAKIDFNSRTKGMDIPVPIKGLREDFKTFVTKGKESIRRVEAFVKDQRALEQTLAFYVPGRVVNSLTLSGVDLSHCRFVDDNEVLHGRFYPGINISIESRQELLARPTETIIIFSRSFGEKIANEIRPMLPPSVRIVLWNELFG